MRWQDIRDRVISDGVEEVERVYDEGDPKRAGALDGFEVAAQIEDPAAFVKVLNARRRREQRVRDGYHERGRPNDDELAAYWRHRWGTLQVEWVFECMRVVWGAQPVLARAAMKVMGIMNDERGR